MTTTKGTIIGLLFAVVCAIQAQSSVVSATTIRVTASSPTGEGPMYTVDIDTTTGTYTENDDGTATWIGSLSNNVFDLGWNFEYDPDPGVSGNLSVTNNTNSVQLFSTTTGVLSSVAAGSGVAMNGASTISVADSDFSGTPATISSPAGGAIYSGMIDADSVHDHAMDGTHMPMTHDDPNSVLLEPGERAELTWTFKKVDGLEFACNLPGHYELGMVGSIEVAG